ncbi:MAG TPA: hypothetical protein VHB77_09855 [Planctomycetaceae bacterium]|nr:hypothetical protein [Planctomycetaceae bacterium]
MRCLLIAVCLLLVGRPALALDAFDRQTADAIKAVAAEQKPLASVSMDEAGRWKLLGAGIESPCIIVKTNAGQWSKALLTWGFRKGPDDKPVAVLMLDRYVTYGTGSTSVASGKEIMLFPGFQFNLGIGQVVPAGFGGDLEFTSAGVLKPIGKAQIFAVNGPPATAAAEGGRAAPRDHEGVLPADFAGTWKVDSDGRWIGVWELEVDEDGNAEGSFLSQESQSTYPVTGKLGALPNQMKLEVKFANATQSVDAYLWSRDKSAMAGTATLAGRKFGFYAVREEGATEKKAK